MSNSKSLLFFVTGVAIGAAAGILLAPQKGTKTRKKLMKRTKNIVNDITGKASDAGKQIKEGYESAKNGLAKAF